MPSGTAIPPLIDISEPCVAVTLTIDASTADDLRRRMTPVARDRGWGEVVALPGDWSSKEQARVDSHDPILTHVEPLGIEADLSRSAYAGDDLPIGVLARAAVLLFSAPEPLPKVSRDVLVLLIQLAKTVGDDTDAKAAWVQLTQLLFDPAVPLHAVGPRGRLAIAVGEPGPGGDPVRLTRDHEYPLICWFVPSLPTLDPGSDHAMGEWAQRMIRKQPRGPYAEVRRATRPPSLTKGEGASVVVHGDTTVCAEEVPSALRLVTLIDVDVMACAARAALVAGLSTARATLAELIATARPDGQQRPSSLSSALRMLRDAQHDLAFTVSPFVSLIGVPGGVFAIEYAECRIHELHLDSKAAATAQALRQVETSLRLNSEDLELQEAKDRQRASDQTLSDLRALLDTGSQLRILASIASVFLVLISAASLFAALGAFPRDDATRWLGPVSSVAVATALSMSVFVSAAIVLVLLAGQSARSERPTAILGVIGSASAAWLLAMELANGPGLSPYGYLGIVALAAGSTAMAIVIGRRRRAGDDEEPPRPEPPVVIECVLLKRDGSDLSYQPLPLEALVEGRTPGGTAEAIATGRGMPPRYLHSTSWRTDGAVVVLTYAAVVDGDRSEAWRPVGPKQPYRPDASPPGPKSVATHAVRHLALLARTDPEALRALDTGWREILAEWPVQPAGQIGGLDG